MTHIHTEEEVINRNTDFIRSHAALLATIALALGADAAVAKNIKLSQWSVPPGSKLTDEQYTSFKSGNLYVNVHSAEHKPGEIRAQLKP